MFLTHGSCVSCDDVLLVPRYSNVGSRNDCDPSAKLLNLQCSLPIMASPMDMVYTSELDILLSDSKIPYIIHRHFLSCEEQVDAAANHISDYRFFAVGSLRNNRRWIDMLLSNEVDKFCVDMAHGDTASSIETVEYIRSKIKDSGLIVAGAVATKSGFRRLEKAGANIIRCGIGSGCFTPDMEVNTKNGLKRIEDVEVGNEVYTHTGELKEVVGLISYKTEAEIYDIDGIECTENHEFYVVHNKFSNVVNENNIHQYAKWIRADELTEDYLLIENLNE